MSSYRFIPKTTLLAAGAMASTNTITSSALDLRTITGAALQIAWTGTPTGTMIIQGSVNGTTYYDIGASVPTQPAGSASGVLLNFVDLMFRYLRVSYTNASGTGTLVVLGMAKTR